MHETGYGIWKPSHLFIDDSGVCYCGRHMGIESTYMPHAWSDLGETTSVTYEGVTIRCEDPGCRPTIREDDEA